MSNFAPHSGDVPDRLERLALFHMPFDPVGLDGSPSSQESFSYVLALQLTEDLSEERHASEHSRLFPLSKEECFPLNLADHVSCVIKGRGVLIKPGIDL